MLLSLQGITHQVHTGVGVVFPDASQPGKRLIKSFSETTYVTFASLEEAEMLAYIKTGEPFDKAGGYGAFTICMCRFTRGKKLVRTLCVLFS
jgi:septum formation protein